ncbi:hypothetical protein NBRC10512_007455 [Rhodotorula toruloides]|uniref:RHTO0S34e00430g1_1 n=2 Tax=Rhodotorula toruloides TaxID=5286 RepID=A0A061BRW4_RHOTO|nr:60S ribosomal protein mitochondrial precursor [Rhodotorula toruloides NP11]EMS18095.1 60S ribosomal protein mitochondrial precursor [Rhodotorula toruloides NP11]KAJ8291418.1 54S ribosomal protein L7, mitochondrial [Rhodotorula toruloides]CDR49811.1 RHTO0S34e00430g1_1 [Rhodotorula toruloides]
MNRTAGALARTATAGARTRQRPPAPLASFAPPSSTRPASTAARAAAGEDADAAERVHALRERLPERIQYGRVARSRLEDHYTHSLSHDLMYLLYSHKRHTEHRPNPLERQLVWDPENPYTRGRDKLPPTRGGRALAPNPSYTSPDSVPRLESIVVECMTKHALQAKSTLLPLIMAFQAITGEPLQSAHPGPYGPGSGKGIVVTRTTKKSASFKVRAGMPSGVKVELRGDEMYQFLETLTDFVLPRLKTFAGIPLPAASTPRQNISLNSGVVAFGLTPDAMGLFPQIEVNLDQYPRLFGMNIFCRTTARGRGAQDQARALLSGMGLPFVKR